MNVTQSRVVEFHVACLKQRLEVKLTNQFEVERHTLDIFI